MTALAIILGARSVIAQAVAREFAAGGFDLQLVARAVDNLADDQADIQVRYGVKVELVALDTSDQVALDQYLADLQASPPSVVVSLLARQEATTPDYQDFAYVKDMALDNYVGPVVIAEKFTAMLQDAGGGTFVGFSSVAGDRGRPGNYLYGSAKAAYTAYLSGLRSRIQTSGVSVLTVKPGVIRTPATLELDFPERWMGLPETVAKDVYRAVQKNRNVIYTPWPWFWVMLIIRHIPEAIFKRLNV